MSQILDDDRGASTTRTRPPSFQFSLDVPQSQERVCYRVQLKEGQDGWIIARCLDVKGAISQGKSRDEALRNIVEAISLILEDTLGEKAQEFTVICV